MVLVRLKKSKYAIMPVAGCDKDRNKNRQLERGGLRCKA